MPALPWAPPVPFPYPGPLGMSKDPSDEIVTWLFPSPWPLHTVRITKSACLNLFRRQGLWQGRLLLGRSERPDLYLRCELRKENGCVCQNRGLSLYFQFGRFHKGWVNCGKVLGNDKLGNHSWLVCSDFRLRPGGQRRCRYQGSVDQSFCCYSYAPAWFDHADMHQACNKENLKSARHEQCRVVDFRLGQQPHGHCLVHW